MVNLIIGYGEVGKALHEVIKIAQIDACVGNCDIMHICFGYNDDFVLNVKRYQDKFNPKNTVIHATVPVGTSRLCDAIHSPIRGVHPYLAAGIKTFVKFLGGDKASEVADFFRKLGVKVMLFDKSETTEAMKLFDTEYYRVCIEFCQRVKSYCNEHNLNFHDVYTLGNQTYNEGYEKLGYPEYRRPVLQPIKGEIGGHCVTSNSKMLT